MIKVKVTTDFPRQPLIRQTPDGKGIWGNCQFFINDDTVDCDYWVVREGLTKTVSANCPAENTILITGEPPSIKTYNQKFTNQFARIITCHRDIKHDHKIYCQQALPWMAGIKFIDKHPASGKDGLMDYDYFKNNKGENKDKLISIIFSTKSSTKGHIQRIDFAARMKSHFGEKLEVFGRGINQISDKWDGLARYKYHLVIENCYLLDWWTEKLSDCYLSLTYPIYYGCPNINKYFSDKALTKIDIEKPDEAIKIIENIIKNDTCSKSLAEIKTAKNLILDKYQFFPMVADLINSEGAKYDVKKTITIKPENYFYDNIPRKLIKLIRKCHATRYEK